MNIVIVGAGNTGRYLATILSKEQHNVIVIDQDKEKLNSLSQSIDVATKVGRANDWQLLDEILELFPDLFMALTNDDNANLVGCSLAKQLGYPSTIARVHDSRYLNRTRLDFGRVFDVDHFICPELLAANEMMKNILNVDAIHIEYFFHGAVQLKTVKMPSSWDKVNVTLSDLHLPEGVMVGLIFRSNPKKKEENRVIFPHGQDVILPGDEVTFIGNSEAMEEILRFCGIKHKEVRSVVLAGGSVTAYHLAKLLEKRHLGLRVIEKDPDRAHFLADHLPETTIVNHDALDLAFLKSEKVDQVDLYISCTSNDETNILSSLLAKEAGAERVLMILSNQESAPILQKLGISHSISPVLSASNRILSQVFTGTVNSLFKMYNDRAEVIEVTVSNDSNLVGIPISDLGPLLPKDFLVAMIQNRGRVIVASGGRILSPGDTVILITSPNHLEELERIF